MISISYQSPQDWIRKFHEDCSKTIYYIWQLYSYSIQDRQVVSCLLTVWLSWLSFALRCFRSIYPDKMNLDFYVVAYCLDRVTGINPDNSELTTKTIAIQTREIVIAWINSCPVVAL